MQGKKTKVWLTRDAGGDYTLHHKKISKFRDATYWSYEDDTLIEILCPRASKKYMGLSKHLKKKEVLEGIMEFKWKEEKCKTKTQ